MPATSRTPRRRGGILSALITPYDAAGAVDMARLAELVPFQLAQGIDGFYVGGSTGEAFLQSVEERIGVLQAVARAASGRCQPFARVGAIATKNSLRMGRFAAEAGYNATPPTRPFYYDFSRAELM